MDLPLELKKKINSFAPQAELMPSVVIVQQLEPFTSIYMSERGLIELGISQKELQELGPEYLGRFFKLEDSEDYLMKLKKLLCENDKDETFSFFQQVKFKNVDNWIWHIGTTRIFFQDEKGNPSHIVTLAVPLDNLKHLPHKAERLLAEKDFFHTNLERFLTLGKRETQILALVAQGESTPKIAEQLCISAHTVKTHRKSIKNKLNISNSYECTLYAHAFDLI